MDTESNVRVAVRIRPQVSSELLQKCSICTSVTPNEPQIWLGSDKAFTFDHVFDIHTQQQFIYEDCVKDLVEGCFNGYNATVLAYGQTGSGKTYTMGTGFDMVGDSNQRGIIPRAIQHLFNGVDQRIQNAKENNRPAPDFKISVQFLELYNEEIIDLLSEDRATKSNNIKIHEDPNGGIYTVGATSRNATTVETVFQFLKKGALSRQTGSTNMNLQSSRSHAIFTITVKQQRISCWSENQESEEMAEPELETLCAKFHFVDLAGSERLKRTGATGERAKEGISINSGLLALGNVISALGDRTKKAQHVPYRDSKLTRLLQDSLGGNSRTLMIACISPSDRDFMETLSTLRYANRAKNIRNKVLANQDKSSQTISLLRKQIAELEVELQEYRQGKRIVNTDGTEQINDMYHENRLLKAELSNIKTRLKALQDTHDRILANNAELLAQKELSDWSNGDGVDKDMSEMIKKYFQEIEELRSKLIETEETCAQLRKQIHKQNRLSLSMSPYVNRQTPYSKFDAPCDDTEEDILNKAKEEVNELKRKLQSCAAQKTQEPNEIETNEEECDDCDDDLEEVQDEGSNNSGNETEDEGCSPELELANLANEILFKERLISELEKSHMKIDQIRQSYEDRLKDFQERYVHIENERDQVLSKLSTEADKNNSAENAKKICEKYEKKLAKLREDIRKLQTMRRQHEEKTKNHYEGKLRTLKCNVEDLKKQKVRLVNQMKEENMRHRENDRIKTKTILQLTKQERVKDVKIRNLEKETDRYRSLLKRKDDEMLHLKKKIRPFNQRAPGRTVSARNNHTQRLANITITKIQPNVLQFTPVQVKQKWQQLQQTISKIILDKQKIAAQEHKMERYLVEREDLGKQLDKAHRKYELALQSNQSEVVVRELQEEIDNYEANIKYLNQNLNECQSMIMTIEEQKEELENVDIKSFLSCGIEEMKYLFEKLLHFALHNGMVAQQKEEERREFELKCKQMANSSMIQEDLLQQLLGGDLFESDAATGIIEKKEDEETAPIKMETGSPGAKENAVPVPELTVSNVTNLLSEPNHLAEAEVHIARYEQLSRNQERPTTKVLRNSNASNQLDLSASRLRRMTMTPSELEESMSFNDKMTQSLCGQQDTETLDRPISRVPSAPALKELTGRIKMEASPVKQRNVNQVPPSAISRQISSDLSESTPPASPPANRRAIREENVFYRLTSNMNHHSSPASGVISRFNGKSAKSSYLVCSHVAEGHNRPVLSVVATEKLMLTGSKDGTAKVWDLTTGKELQSLREHSDSVVCVRYDETSQLAFTVSKCFIKVWDLRESPTKFVKTMSSNGITEFCPTSRQGEGAGESRIHEVQLNPQGTKLFSTCLQIVRVWDLRMFHAIGKLNSNHQSNITCMAVEDSPDGYITVVTGSKDRYLKVFDFPDGAGGCILPRCTFEPPHLDGVSAVALHKSLLFSASRDGNIKQWDLQSDLGKNLNSNHTAHKDSVLALHIADRFSANCDLPRFQGNSYGRNNGQGNPLLVSGCKGGRIKLWDAHSFTPLAEIKAHQASVHSVYSNSSFIFTASSDCTIGLWRRRTSTDPSLDYADDFAAVA